jgi:hypothetical protein
MFLFFCLRSERGDCDSDLVGEAARGWRARVLNNSGMPSPREAVSHYGAPHIDDYCRVRDGRRNKRKIGTEGWHISSSWCDNCFLCHRAQHPRATRLLFRALFFLRKKKKKRKYIPQMLLIRIAKMSSTISHGEKKNPLKKKNNCIREWFGG